MGVLSVVGRDCPWSLSGKRAYYSVTLKGHLEGAINLQMNMSATFQEGKQMISLKWLDKIKETLEGKINLTKSFGSSFNIFFILCKKKIK